MLINFTVENFYSIKTEISLSMESTKNKTDHLFNHFEIGNLNLLKSSVIFGPNASGKSNLLLAMKYMRDIVENRHLRKSIKDTSFLFDEDYIDKPTKYEVKFLYKDVIYRYGFKIKKSIIIEEWLFAKKNIFRAREIQYFQRNLQEFTNYSVFAKEADLIKKGNKTREDKLYLSVIADFNGEISRDIINWFSKFNSFSSIHSEFLPFTLEKFENEISRKKVVDLVQSADFGIVDIEKSKISFDDLDLNNNDIEIPEKLLEEMKENGLTSINTIHNSFKGDKFTSLKSLSFSKESDGTRKFFELSGPIIEALENGEILVIDELDNSFHTKMTESLIKLFNSDKNINNAQLIFVSHDTNVLNQKLFRRDQVWFVEKNNYGVTELCSLIDFGTRIDTRLQKNYLEGKYGSIPFINELEVKI